jgi:hypothetical protein
MSAATAKLAAERWAGHFDVICVCVYAPEEARSS